MGKDIFTPHIPLYAAVREALTIFSGESLADIVEMMHSLDGQLGTPQNPVDWSDPDTWIPNRLQGQSQLIAHRIWNQSHHLLNPRYCHGVYWFTYTIHDLLEKDRSGLLKVTMQGERFLSGDKALIRQIDEHEGIIQLLVILAPKGDAQRADILPEWTEYLLAVSKYRKPGAINTLLRDRLRILTERGLIKREGNTYTITPDGVQYISAVSQESPDPRREVLKSIQQFNMTQRTSLREKLGIMPSYQFEHLVGALLDAMNYENVIVTQPSSDKGVDVVATAQFGITTITEVIQVKRYQGSITRPVLDQLRGALPYHKAIRGTIITLGTFSKNCPEAAIFQGAAPITLIDGERLIDLLIEHEIGIRKRPATLYELDESFLTTNNELEVDDNAIEV